LDEVGAAPRPGRRIEKVISGWARHYRRAWLGRDAIAGIVIWSVVVPQAVAYPQIAKLPRRPGSPPRPWR
jgi:SulP family sulfate permease